MRGKELLLNQGRPNSGPRATTQKFCRFQTLSIRGNATFYDRENGQPAMMAKHCEVFTFFTNKDIFGLF